MKVLPQSVYGLAAANCEKDAKSMNATDRQSGQWQIFKFRVNDLPYSFPILYKIKYATSFCGAHAYFNGLAAHNRRHRRRRRRRCITHSAHMPAWNYMKSMLKTNTTL